MRAVFARQVAKRWFIAAVILSVFSVGTVVIGDRFSRAEYAKRTTIHLRDGVLAPQTPAAAANFLMIGHDATGNSDTMMVVHEDPVVPAPLVVSFPRDLMVDVPGYGRRQLNSAWSLGGPTLLIRTLTTDFGIRIQHYLQVDFSSFPQIINAIGRISVWFPTAVHDPYIGLNVAEPGCVSLDGQAALAYVRSRHYYVPDNLTHPAPWQWNYDPKLPETAYRGGTGWTAIGSDIERIPRQQYFLRTVAQTAIKRTNDDPLRLIGLVDAVMRHLITDQTLTLNELKSLVRTFHRLKPAQVAMTTIPWKPDPSNANRVVVKYPDASALLNQLANFSPARGFLPRLVKPGTVRVRVVNGSNVANLGSRVLHELTAAGFHSAGPAENADRSNYTHTEIRWNATSTSKGLTVTFATGATSAGQATTSTETLGADVLVIVGNDWTQLHQNFGALSSTASAASTTTTRPAATTTTPTTTPVDRRYLPVDPTTGGILVGCPHN